MLYPGYVLVEMEMNDELWHAVKATPRVTGFVGGGTKPVPLSADEVNSVLYRQATSAERPRPKLKFEKNENCAASSTGRSRISPARWTKSTAIAIHCA